MRVTVPTTSANITGNPIRTRKVARRRMRRALRRPGCAMGQEVARSNRFRRGGDYSAAWAGIAREYGKRTHGGPREVPISTPASYTIHGTDMHRVHGGRAGVSPARYINEVRAEIGGLKVAFVDCHPVSRKYLGGWRRRMWDLYMRRLAQIVARLHADGYTVIFGGDLNSLARGLPVIHPAQRRLISSGLDHLFIVPADGVRVRVTATQKIRRTILMDHPIISATVELAA